MAESQWARVREMFEAALDLEAAERSELLDAECGGDADLRAHVERLLAADAEATSDDLHKADAIPANLAATGLEGLLIGQSIGAYEIRSVLGVGGMGTVYEAMQDNPKRIVALKTMRFGLRSGSAMRRFAYEAEVLGSLRHPAIAQIYDAGTWRDESSGRELPYFAIEFVPDAAPLVEFVTKRDLGLTETLELFIQVLDGVQHGHARGFIHRDLKPENILVDDAGRPKIIDFGIARATTPDTTQLTEAGQALGTLSTMAPEQLDGDPDAIDTRVDIYALGVIFYELLSGDLPFDPTDMPLTEFARRVHHEEPAPPSAGAGSFAKSGFAVELDWITHTAMAALPEDRYSTIAEFRADIQRLLHNEPVSVGPISTSYLVRKFVRRHRTLVTASVLICIAVIIGSIGMAWQWRRAENALVQTAREAERAWTVTRFFSATLQMGDVFDDSSGQGPPTLKQAIDAAAERVGGLSSEPLVEAHIRFTLGSIKRSAGELDESRKHLRRCLELREGELGAVHRDVAEVLNCLALTENAAGNPKPATEYYTRCLAILAELGTTDDPVVARANLNLGFLNRKIGELETAEAYIRRAIAAYDALSEPKPGEAATALAHLADIVRASGRVEDSIALYYKVLSAYVDAGRGEHPYSAMTQTSLGHQLIEHGQPAEAVELLQAAITILERTLGAAHDSTINAQYELGLAYIAMHLPTRAVEALSTAARGCAQKPRGPNSIQIGRVLVDVLIGEKRWKEALPHLRMLRDWNLATANGSPSTATQKNTLDLTLCLSRGGDPTTAESELHTLLDELDSAEEPDASILRRTLTQLVALYAAGGRAEAAKEIRKRLASLGR